MNHLLPILAFALLLTGCGDKQTAQEKAESDAAAVAAVKAAQDRKPPVVPVTPEPLTIAEMKHAAFSGQRCTFRPDGAVDARPVLAIAAKKGLLKIDGRPAVVAADTGSSALPYGTHARYSGRVNALRIDEDGSVPSNSAEAWRGIVTIIDQFERPVFTAKGSFDCTV
jgi:hypothetical protein